MDSLGDRPLGKYSFPRNLGSHEIPCTDPLRGRRDSGGAYPCRAGRGRRHHPAVSDEPAIGSEHFRCPRPRVGEGTRVGVVLRIRPVTRVLPVLPPPSVRTDPGRVSPRRGDPCDTPTLGHPEGPSPTGRYERKEHEMDSFVRWTRTVVGSRGLIFVFVSARDERREDPTGQVGLPW